MRPLLFIILSLINCACAAPKLVLPDESYPLLRRDLLPLDVDGIHELAVHLATLGDGPAPIEASELRERVKILTLGQRLSPSEARVRAALQALQDGDPRPAPTNQEFNESRDSALATAQWLIDLPADTEGHLLGQLILDTLAPLIPKNPMIARRDAEGEPDRWRGVVASVGKFRGTPEAAPSPTPPDPPVTPTPADPTSAYKTLTQQTTVPMLCKAIPQNSPIKPALIKTSLVISEKREDSGALRFVPSPDFSLDPLNGTLRNFFRTIGRPLPEGLDLNIRTDSRQYTAGNKLNIAAPIAMMLDAALTGRPLRKNTLFFARLSPDGSLDRPDEAWEILLHLVGTDPQRGTRLIVGPGLSEEMKALLVIRKPGFFIDFEVIVAPTFELARELFYEDGEPSPELEAAIAGFQEVREKAREASSLPAFLAISSVEARLVKVREASPSHLSGALLAIQSIRRPFALSRYMLAQEIDRRLQPLADFKYDPQKTSAREIRDLYKETRESLQQLEKLIGLRDQDLLKESLDLIKPLNSIAGDVGTLLYETLPEMVTLKHRVVEFRTKLKQIYQIAPPD